MKCVCGANSHVLNTHLEPDGVRRRRECEKGHRFTTHEITEDDLNHLRKRVFTFQQLRRLLREDNEL